MKNKIGVKGRFHPQIVNSDGSIELDLGVQDNLITDAALGFDNFMSGSTYLCLGSGVVTEPSVTDTNLGNQVAQSSSTVRFSTKKELSSYDSNGFHITLTSVTEFEGLSTEITELGLRRDNSTTGTLITRALIKDLAGNPTSISVGAGQTLRLTYLMYMYFPHSLGTGVTSTIHGDMHWEIKFSRPLDDNGLSSALSMAYSSFGWMGGYSSDRYYKYMMGNSLDSLHQVVDTANMTKTITGVRPAKTTDYTVTTSHSQSGSIWYLSSIRNNSRAAGYSVYATQPFTLPKNYDFEMTVQISWGRLP